MTPEQKQRLKEVEENRRVWHGNMGQVTRDIDFLLSLVKSQEAQSKEQDEQDNIVNMDHLDSAACRNSPDRLPNRALDGKDEISSEVDLYCPDCKSKFRGNSSNIGLIHSCDNQRGSSSGSSSRIRRRERQPMPNYVWLEPPAADFYSTPLNSREIKYARIDPSAAVDGDTGDIATSMRSACVGEVKTLWSTSRSADYNDAVNDAVRKLESLSIEQPKE